jgi:hypothetical protein
MLICCMMGFVKNKEVNVSTHVDVPVTHGIKEDLRGANNYSVCFNHPLPNLRILPLIRL